MSVATTILSCHIQKSWSPNVPIITQIASDSRQTTAKTGPHLPKTLPWGLPITDVQARVPMNINFWNLWSPSDLVDPLVQVCRMSPDPRKFASWIGLCRALSTIHQWDLECKVLRCVQALATDSTHRLYCVQTDSADNSGQFYNHIKVMDIALPKCSLKFRCCTMCKIPDKTVGPFWKQFPFLEVEEGGYCGR